LMISSIWVSDSETGSWFMKWLFMSHSPAQNQFVAGF
jgi:hypothetical protein